MRDDTSRVTSNRRIEHIHEALGKLNDTERAHLQRAADGPLLGGDPLNEPLRGKVVDMELAFKSSGRLRTDVYKILQVNDVTIVKRK